MASKSNILELELFEAKSFMGIDQSQPVVIEFPKNRKKGFVELSGDQGRKKTSTLMGILYAMCAQFDIDKKKLFNSMDKGLDEELQFSFEGDRYRIEVGSTRISLKKEVEEGKWKPQDTPVAMIQKMFGPVGLSPYKLKEMRGKDQIKYFQDVFGSGEDASKKMKKLESDIETVFVQRRDVNRDIKTLRSALEIEPLFQNYERSQARFKSAPSAAKEKAAFDDAAQKKQEFDKNSATLSGLEAQAKEISSNIEDLKRRLSEEEARLKETTARIEKGKKWVADNKNVEKVYDEAQQRFMSISKELADYDKWKDIQKREKSLIEMEEMSQTATGHLDSLRTELLKLTQSCLPKVKGLTIKVNAGIDKEAQEDGVFYNDQPIHELSESEYADLWCKIWDAAGVQFVFLENITSFGSDVVSTLNDFVKNGGTVFYTRMDRKQKELGVSFKTKVE